MSKQLIVKGHTLPFEGRMMDHNGPGFGRCSCGTTSSHLLRNTAARKRWHRDHKLTVLTALRGIGDGR